MKKIGIITIHNSPNYGASLQAFALYEYIRQQGADVEIIDLHRPNAHADFKPSKQFQPYRPPKSKGLNKLKIQIKQTLYTLRHGRSKVCIMGYNEVSLAKFHLFNSVIRMSKPYKSIDALYANPPTYDVYITGSDQLWNPTQQFCLEPFFLTFVHNNVIKLSYASSIGVSELSDREKSDFKQWLSSYNRISVREKQAQKMLNELSIDKEVEQVSDPTFLLDRDLWRVLAKKTTKKGYIMLFPLMHDKNLLAYAIRLAKESGKELVIVDQRKHPKGDYTLITDAGPLEWLGWIANADIVLTDSFHGTVFSLLLGNTNFFSYIAPTNKRGSRITDLLKTFNMEDHLLNIDLQDNYQQLSSLQPNYEQIAYIFRKEQLKSRLFLEPYI